MKQQQNEKRRVRAERVYTRFLRLYPRAHQQAFGEPMLQAFRDHYGDAIETEGEQTARFWLRVVGDEGKSLLREHMAAFAERMWFMQATANIEASDLHAYHFSSSRVEVSTLALARAAGGASAARTPAFLLDGEEASRLTTDLRVVEGRLPAPAVGVLEVVVTKASADQLHLAHCWLS